MGLRLEFIVSGQPIPACRMTQKGKFYSKQAQVYLGYRDLVATRAKQERVFRKMATFERECAVSLYFKREGSRKVDLDNLIKAVLDSLQAGGIVANDNLVTSIGATLQCGYIKGEGEVWVSIVEKP